MNNIFELKQNEVVFIFGGKKKRKVKKKRKTMPKAKNINSDPIYGYDSYAANAGMFLGFIFFLMSIVENTLEQPNSGKYMYLGTTFILPSATYAFYIRRNSIRL